MALATMTSKGQVTIPKEVREKLSIKPKDRLVITVIGDHAVVHPLHGDILGLKGFLHKKGMKPIDFRKLRQEAEEGMAQEALERSGIRPPKSSR